MDTIANMFVQIKNAIRTSQKEIEVPFAKVKLAILEVLKNKGYVESYEEIKVEEKKYPAGIKIIFKFKENKAPALTDIKRISTPGRRVYVGAGKLKTYIRLGGGADVLVSTSSGIMSGRDARKKGLGGEIIGEMK